MKAREIRRLRTQVQYKVRFKMAAIMVIGGTTTISQTPWKRARLSAARHNQPHQLPSRQ